VEKSDFPKVYFSKVEDFARFFHEVSAKQGKAISQRLKILLAFLTKLRGKKRFFKVEDLDQPLLKVDHL
jgi:hypothetical protein